MCEYLVGLVVSDSETPQTVTCQVLLSMGFSGQEYWCGLPCPPPRDLPNPVIKPISPVAPAFQVASLPLSHLGRSQLYIYMDLPGGVKGKEPDCQCRSHRRHGFDPWVRKIPWRGAWQHTAVCLPGETHGLRSLVGYSP